MKKINSFLKIFLPLFIGIIFIYLTYNSTSYEERKLIFYNIKNANYSFVILSILLGFLSHLSRAYRWKFLLAPMGYHYKAQNIKGKQHLEHVIPQNKIITAYLNDKISSDLVLQMPLCLIDDADKHILEGDWQTAGNWEYPFRRYKLAGYTKIIKDGSKEMKSEIIEQLWKILISDKNVDQYESNLMRRICGLIYFSDKESGEIKMRLSKK